MWHEVLLKLHGFVSFHSTTFSSWIFGGPLFFLVMEETRERGFCFAQRLIFNCIFSLEAFILPPLLHFFFVMAMARSFGNKEHHTKACRRVEMSNKETMVEDMRERTRASALLMTLGTCSAYLMVANDAVVIGKV